MTILELKHKFLHKDLSRDEAINSYKDLDWEHSLKCSGNEENCYECGDLVELSEMLQISVPAPGIIIRIEDSTVETILKAKEDN